MTTTSTHTWSPIASVYQTSLYGSSQSAARVQPSARDQYTKKPSAKQNGVPVQAQTNVISSTAQTLFKTLSSNQSMKEQVEAYLRFVTLCFILEVGISIIYFTIIGVVAIVKPNGNENQADILVVFAAPHLFLGILYFMIIRTRNFLYVMRTTSTVVLIALLCDVVVCGWRLYIQIACALGLDPVLSNKTDCKQFVGEDWTLFGIGLGMIVIDVLGLIFVSKLSRLQDLRFVTLQQMTSSMRKPLFNLKSWSVILLFLTSILTILSIVMLLALGLTQGDVSSNVSNFLFVAIRSTVHVGIALLLAEVIFGQRKASDCLFLSFACGASLCFLQIVVLIGLSNNLACKYDTTPSVLDTDDTCAKFTGTNWVHFGMNLAYLCLDFFIFTVAMLYLGVQEEVIKFVNAEFKQDLEAAEHAIKSGVGVGARS